ncbi:Solute carrier family 25 member 40 [Amphibalanus amphitrite]|uniref:Solute carrier family 25 member 40 n=1 Tax=Amphibalanus amphitrite TaxID=1232801 RepID=A0A6A4VRE7_AMPAM|nr:solute carrier family 25 member 40-like [Amphibalanus amphitrite]KAF0293272.1 Solute carrier family 25 member 40 [Amphibalanus amphitrite]KAF0294387.1 Solute carrier family 25 member 40 [Amphibalanus amphitrite]
MARQPLSVDDPVLGASAAQQMAASCTGAVLTSVTMTPLDVVKIRMQAQQRARSAQRCFLYCNGLMDHLCICVNGQSGGAASGCGPAAACRAAEPAATSWYRRPCPPVYTGSVDAALQIARAEGVRSLWSGLSPTLVSAIPSTVVYFATYDQSRQYLRARFGSAASPQPAWVPMVAGAAARVWASTLVAPLELVRTRMQAQRMRYTELGGAVRVLLREEGVRGLWKGLTPTLIRDVPFSAVYWAGYEGLKLAAGQQTPSALFSFAAGSAAGTVAAVVTLPFDVVKTHWQIEFGQRLGAPDSGGGRPPRPGGVLASLREIHGRAGVPGLFAGLVPRVVKVAPACAIMITTYEGGKAFFLRRNERRAREREAAEAPV